MPLTDLQGRKKIELVQRFTELNVTVLISDVDTVWLRRPFEYVKRYPEADVLTSSDSLAETHPDDGLEDWRRAGAAYNIGIMLFSPRAAAFAAAWVAALEADEKVWDQAVFNGCMPHATPAAVFAAGAVGAAAAAAVDVASLPRGAL